jgi:hypothetical protein
METKYLVMKNTLNEINNKLHVTKVEINRSEDITIGAIEI